jgi:hypothetical protein
VYLNVPIVYFNVFIIYFNVFIIHFNAFVVCFNVFIDIVIGISPSHSHCNVFAIACTSTYTFFFHSTQWLPSQHAMPLHFFFSIPIDPFQLSCNLWKIAYQSLLFTSTHHPTFQVPHSISSLVAHSIAEPKFDFLFVSMLLYAY